MPFEFRCDQCGATFARHTRRTGASGGAYCTRACYWLSMRKPVKHQTCRGCGKDFDPRAGGGRKPNLKREFCNRACYDRSRATTLERWLATQSGDGCWPWPHGTNKDGYGVIWRGDDGQQLLTHRATWLLLVGPIPDDMTLDHMCHNRDDSCPGGRTCRHRRCANPAHLVVAGDVENSLRGKSPPAVNARKEKCDKGHEFTPENTYVTPAGARQCRRCQKKREAEYRQRRRQKLAAAAA